MRERERGGWDGYLEWIHVHYHILAENESLAALLIGKTALNATRIIAQRTSIFLFVGHMPSHRSETPASLTRFRCPRNCVLAPEPVEVVSVLCSASVASVIRRWNIPVQKAMLATTMFKQALIMEFDSPILSLLPCRHVSELST